MRFLDPTAVFRNFLMNAYAGGTSRAERSALMPPQPNDILTPEGEAEFYANRIFPLLTTPWKVFLILNFGEHTIRFGSLKLCLQAVSRVTLTKYLHELERDGFVQRIEYPAPPLRTEYSLTPMGLSLLPILQELAEWGEQ